MGGTRTEHVRLTHIKAEGHSDAAGAARWEKRFQR